jgi:hypothetical protein
MYISLSFFLFNNDRIAIPPFNKYSVMEETSAPLVQIKISNSFNRNINT